MRAALFQRRRRRRRALVTSVEVTPSGGEWAFTPGAGSLGNLTCSTDVTPTRDDVGIESSVGLSAFVTGDGGSTASRVDSGSVGPQSIAAATPAVFYPSNFDGGRFSVSGRVMFTSEGSVTTLYILTAQDV